MVAHTTQFAQPGWRYLDSGCAMLPAGGSVVALTHQQDFSVIAETLDATTPQTLAVTVQGGLKDQQQVHVWKSDARQQFIRQQPIVPQDGKFRLTMEPQAIYSLTTTTGQGKGGAKSPPAKPFPLPYLDTFDDGEPGTTTGRYFIEQNGSYEFTSAPGRGGLCLRQVVNRLPIVWTYGKEANAMGALCLIGDKEWANYEVSADVLLEEPGYARVAGRIARAQLNSTISGYQFHLWDTGEWRLTTRTWTPAGEGVIAEGKVQPPAGRWVNLKLRFMDDQVSAAVDGTEVCAVKDQTYQRGMAGFGNEWNRGCYDNLRIQAIDGRELMARRGTHTAPPATAPKLHKAEAQSQAVELAWTAVDGAEGYKVIYGSDPQNLNGVADAGVATNYRCWTLTNGITYHFAIVPYNDRGDGPRSETMAATPQAR
jgi:hypothetical protein